MQKTSVKKFIYAPHDLFSKNLFKTIPTKVLAWLSNMGIHDKDGSAFDLEWHIGNGNAASYLLLDDDAGAVQILWNGSLKKIIRVRGTEPWFENLSKNLDEFVSLEHRIYTQLQMMEMQIENRNIQAFQTD